LSTSVNGPLGFNRILSYVSEVAEGVSGTTGDKRSFAAGATIVYLSAYSSLLVTDLFTECLKLLLDNLCRFR
jgi:hypothetical protein